MHRVLNSVIAVACLFTAQQALAAPFRGSCVRTALSSHGGVYTSTLEGSATQIGDFVGVSTITFPTGHHAVGPLTITNARGDSITMDTDVVFDNHFIAGYGSYTITGGGGRFSGATGSGSFQVVHDINGATVISWDGTLGAEVVRIEPTKLGQRTGIIRASKF